MYTCDERKALQPELYLSTQESNEIVQVKNVVKEKNL